MKAGAPRRGAPAPNPAPDLAPATISEFDGVRFLHLDTPWVQGAMRIGKPLALELEYIQRMMAWMLLRPQGEVAAGLAVQLGLGAGAITRFVHTTLRMRATAVELNPSVIDACRLWFHLPADSERLRTVQADAARYAADPENAGTALSLCVDLYDHDAAGPVHDSAAFYRDCRRLLADGGVLSVNLFGRDASFERSAARIAEAFGAGRARSLRPTREGNTVVLAIAGADVPDRETLATRAAAIEAQWKLPARKWLRMLRPLPVAPTPALPDAESDTISRDRAPPRRGTLGR